LKSETPGLYPSAPIVPSAGKTALVLSSGGLFGAYQAGVWSYLSETSFRPDVVVGASVGALNGWAIAGGCGTHELAERWLDEKQSNVLRRRAESGLLAGYFHREPLQRLTSTIFENYRSSPNFGLVVVELPFLQTRLITGSSVTANHLLATASIPVAMPTVSIGGQRFTDGGLLEDVPLWAAIKMGATRIIAVDAMHFDCPWWYRVGVSPMGFFAPRLGSGVKALTTLIRPSHPLGHFSEALTWDRDRIQRWIDRGYEDAHRTMARARILSSASA
jgi:predicted acylesterase/phospholipase RssA